MDLLALPRTSRCYVACLVAINHFSKWAVVKPLKDKMAKSVSESFEQRVLLSFTRMPSRILSDNGKEFRSSFFNEILEKYGIGYIYSNPYKASLNGAIERVNRTLL